MTCHSHRASSSMRKLFFFVLIILVGSSAHAGNKPVKSGDWRGVLKLNDSTELPFTFTVKEMGFNYIIEIANGVERVRVEEVSLNKDSVVLKMPVFDSEFRLKNTGDSLKGYWYNYARKDKNKIPFRAKFKGGSRFQAGEVPGDPLIPSNWEAVFSQGTEQAYPAQGIFRKKLNYVNGTFLTETGDFRFLEGVDNGKEIKMSSFDGGRAMYFHARYITPDSLSGVFYSGMHWSEKWSARRNDSFRLKDPETLTRMKPGVDKIDFSFYNLEGKKVSLSDPQYKGKAVIVQITGTWCPNCMDETAYLAELHRKYQEKGLEVIALAFERTDSAKAVRNVQRLKFRYAANYQFLVTNKTGKTGVAEALPMLENFMAFPTTIFIDKKGKVRKIHTGFNGPGTGEYYERYALATDEFVQKLLKEKK